MSTSPFAYVDLETDGLHHGRQIYEIAIIRRDFKEAGGWTETTFETFVHVAGFSLSDDYGIKVGGFYDRHPQGREMTGKPPIPGAEVMSRKTAALKVHQLLHGVHLVGVNPTFDATTLSALLRAEGLPSEPWHYHLIDLGAMAYGYLTARGEHVDIPWRSYQLAQDCGVELAAEADRHTALADAEWAKRWHDTLTGRTAAEAAA